MATARKSDKFDIYLTLTCFLFLFNNKHKSMTNNLSTSEMQMIYYAKVIK